jgi:hypothetical protein
LPFNIREADISRTAGAFHGAAFSLVAQRQISLKKALALYKCFFLAGTAGFEPANAGVKVRCLTAWRRPNITNVYIISYFFFDVKSFLAKSARMCKIL